LLSTLGGLAGFGLAGIIIGPIIAAFFLSIWQMAEHEFGPAYQAQVEGAPAPPVGAPPARSSTESSAGAS
jgi:predicted PurR-regulated permease PerM